MAEGKGHRLAWEKLAEFLTNSDGRVLVLVVDKVLNKIKIGTGLAPGRFRFATNERADANLVGIAAVAHISSTSSHKLGIKFKRPAGKANIPFFQGLKATDFVRACRGAFERAKEEQVKTANALKEQTMTEYPPTEPEKPPELLSIKRNWSDLSPDEREVILIEIREFITSQGGKVSKLVFAKWLAKQGVNSLSAVRLLVAKGVIERIVTSGNDKGKAGFYSLPVHKDPHPIVVKRSALEILAAEEAAHAARVAELKKQAVEELNIELDAVMKELAAAEYRVKELKERQASLEKRKEQLSM